MGCIVVPHDLPTPHANHFELGDGRVLRVDLEDAGPRGSQRLAKDRIDDTSMAHDERRTGSDPVDERPHCRTHTDLELSDRLSARERHSVGIVLPIGIPESSCEFVVSESIAFGTRIMFSERLDHVHIESIERGAHDVGSFDGSRIGRADDDIG